MRKTRLISLVISAVAAIFAVYLIFAVLHVRKPEAQPVAPPPPEPPKVTQVLVSSTPISRGEALDDHNLVWAEWPIVNVRPDFISQEHEPDARKAYAGRHAVGSIPAGTPVTESLLTAPGSDLMISRIAPGNRAISVHIDAVHFAGGFISPEDHVDIYTVPHSGQAGMQIGPIKMPVPDTSQPGPGSAGHLLLANVRVLAVDQAIAPPSDSKADTNVSTVTLEVPVANAAAIAKANEDSQIVFTLRGKDDNQVAQPSSPPVAIIAYGIKKTQ